MSSAAPSTYSDEYSGSVAATHSPQPWPSGGTARSRTTSRSDSTPDDVRNGATKGNETRRSSNPVSLTAAPSPLRTTPTARIPSLVPRLRRGPQAHPGRPGATVSRRPDSPGEVSRYPRGSGPGRSVHPYVTDPQPPACYPALT